MANAIRADPERLVAVKVVVDMGDRYVPPAIMDFAHSSAAIQLSPVGVCPGSFVSVSVTSSNDRWQTPYAPRVSDRSPKTTYRQIIDALVAKTESVGEQLLREEHIYSRARGNEAINSFTQALPDEERELIARICRAERFGAIHDVLAELSWWIDCEDVALTVDGVDLPVDESGMGLHGDFVGRLDDWPWPAT